MSYNPSKSTYTNPNIEYLFNSEIIEYDMQDAGLSIIKTYGLLPKVDIQSLEGLDKDARNRQVGILQINNKFLKDSLLEKFAEMRKLFIEANDLTDHRIISVKKDAIYVIGECKNLKFGKVVFVKKNEYSSYIRLAANNNIEIYYKDRTLDIKGIGDITLNRHRLYLMEFLDKIISDIEMKNVSVKRYIVKFISDYKAMRLEDGFYLEFNNMSRDINPIYNYEKVIVPLVQIIMKEL